MVGQNVTCHECKVDYTKFKVVKWLKVWCNFYVPCTVHTFVFTGTESRVNKGIATLKKNSSYTDNYVPVYSYAEDIITGASILTSYKNRKLLPNVSILSEEIVHCNYIQKYLTLWIQGW